MAWRISTQHGRVVRTSVALWLSLAGAPLHASAAPAPLEYIDRNATLFGVEYTFQDQEMVNEPGRMTMTSPHKEAKLKVVVETYLSELGLPSEAVRTKFDFKGGVSIDVPGDGKHVLNPEPVTIEINTTPKRADQILEAARPVFKAAQAADLVPYVQPAAERSGMGHIHVGGASIGESPFYRNPTLLRNTLVYLHQHPAALYGFAEAYDVGDNSNIETYHSPVRQEAFKKAISEFDEWYLGARKAGESTDEALLKLLRILKANDRESIGFFRHYRYINLEHLKELSFERLTSDTLEEFETKKGKFTVEFRNFRPQKSPEHAVADAEYLLRLMDRLSNPDELVPFRTVSAGEFQRYFTASSLAADWEFVRRDLKLAEAGIDTMATEKIQEAIQALHSQRISHAGSMGIELYPSFSEKQAKGTFFEARLKALPGQLEPPQVELQNQPLEFEKIRIGDQDYWVASIDTRKLKVTPDELKGGILRQIGPTFTDCLRKALNAL